MPFDTANPQRETLLRKNSNHEREKWRASWIALESSTSRYFRLCGLIYVVLTPESFLMSRIKHLAVNSSVSVEGKVGSRHTFELTYRGGETGSDSTGLVSFGMSCYYYFLKNLRLV